MNDYFDVFYQAGESPVFCYRSGLAVHEETLYNGVLVSSGYNAAGYPLNVLTNFPSRLNPADFAEPSAFNIEIDGQCIDYGLKFIDFQSVRIEDRIQAILTLESELKPVRISIHTILDGSQMFTRFIEIENLSDSPMNLSRLSLLSGGLEKIEKSRFTAENDIKKIYSIGYYDNADWGREGMFSWHDLPPASFSVDSRFGRDRFRHPLVFIRNNLTGLIYFSQIGWSGGCRFTADYNATTERDSCYLAFKAEITSHKPMIIIEPKSVFTTPEVHMGVVSGGLDDAVNEMHSHIRKSVLDMYEATPGACLVGAGMGAEHDMSVKTSKAFINQFAEMGGEVFIIDAGWECPPDKETEWGEHNGINIPNAERYPNGLEELRNYCHSKGLKFGLWVDIETLGRKSGIIDKHPEWRAKNIFGIQSSNLIDMSQPEVARWAEDELARIITEYKLDLLRVDHNVSFRDYFTVSGGECNSIRHHQAVYEIYRNLKRRFPNVIFENCAGGGARTDLGMMKNFNHTWVSDCQKAPYSVMITNGMTMALPPERVDRLFAGMGCHEQGSLDLHMRNTMLTHMSLNVISPAAACVNSVQMEFVRHSVDIYKNFIRKFLPFAKTYHHTPEAAGSPDSGFSALEIASPDGIQGAIAVFTLTNTQANRFTVIPRGIRADLSYRVTLDNSRTSFTASGYELLQNGIAVSIPAPLSSELVLYEEVK